MTITLSRLDYDELWRESNPIPQRLDDASYSEKTGVIPKRLGQGYQQTIHLREITLCIFNYSLHEDLLIQDQGASAEWEFGFHLSGDRYGKRGGENFLNWGFYEGEWIGRTSAKEPILKVDIHLNSPNTLSQLIADELTELPGEIRQLLEQDEGKNYNDINTITPTMRLVLEQLLHCPFKGKTRHIYLESKCLELIALKLEQIKSETTQSTQSSSLYSLKPDDVDRIHVARQILLAQPDNPPSLLELARQAGLNDYKLKLGFRQVFGTTVFNYLHRYRMEKAHQLLLGNRMNVKEVAQAVGYANQSRFAAAFRKQFGINPKALLNKKSV
jgi:AraC family transcriptional regulator, transcriptional activator of the genes for pyochelin and ferripyochelin receptors